LWGAATAAHQVEGENTNSDWWQAEQAGRVPFKSGAACEQYTRYESDFDLAVELGHNAHRLSVEWARIEPTPGVFDDEQIEHYVEVLKALKARGLASYVTLHHFTNPLWFAQRGGWADHEAPHAFERYVRRVAAPLAPYVDYWLTFNEPTSVPYQGYITGEWPPNRRGALPTALRVIDSQAAAHKLAYRALHSVVPGAIVGYTSAFIDWRPRRENSSIHRQMCRLLTHVTNHRFSDRVGQETDLIGVQYYFTLLAGVRPYPPGAIVAADKSDLGWDISPEGLRRVVADVWNRYGKPIHVTENGLADADDTRRERFIRSHLSELHKAIVDGADVRAYLHWTLIDNFEWSFGYAPRFGLIEIDRDTQSRSIRPSARAYAQIIRQNGFEQKE
jgi:beta-glucosidase